MWRNRVVKLHKNSIRNYFTHRCNDNVGSKNFYKTIKPFLSTKQSHYNGSKTILKENDSIISDASKVADIFNMYYESIAEYKFQSDGLDNLDFDEAIAKHASHTSISLIKQSISRNYEFSFSPISVQSMSEYISLLKSNKAVGHDGLHAAYLKCSGDNMSTSLCNVFNACISSCDFPSTLKWICAKKITGLLMYWPLFLRYLKKFYPISWWLTLYLYWIIRYLLIELVIAASTWFYNSPNFSANHLIKEIVSELWQWICQRPLIACHMDS